MNFKLTEEQKLIQKTAKEFATNELMPELFLETLKKNGHLKR